MKRHLLVLDLFVVERYVDLLERCHVIQYPFVPLWKEDLVPFEPG
jgi:hypothetical protein